ncbi:MAG: hypothetical protein KME41_15675 [Candidatus Thiodiazotropha sp. (ex Lucina pensylvanica)]|nr:hypothetical protein [Candidatus Thiodiazotropha sp. (ex Lucina pensylvanica)]MCG7862734.1 hypothetical protein [Candidatus Thiodiazotropha endolucinida]
MNWKPTSEAEIWDEINESWERMTIPQRRLWEVIKVDPVKWQQTPYGDEGVGFWVVAIFGETVIWYNDIEEGFNRSSYTKPGEINEYWCNQDNLEWTIQHVLDEIKEGNPSGGYAGPPEPIA